MFGNVGFQVAVGPNVHANAPMKKVFLAGGKMTDYARRNKFNTTISSIIVLCRYPVGRTREKIAARECERNLGRELTLDEMLELRCPTLREHERQLGRELTLNELDEMLEHSRPIANEEIDNPVRVVVHENPVARIPLSRELFCGPFDERWGQEGDHMSRGFVGDRLREIESRLFDATTNGGPVKGKNAE